MSGLSSQSSHITPARAAQLAVDNLVKIFSNRDPETRLATIKATYAPDFTVFEPNQVVVRGYDQLNDTVSKLLAQDDRKDWEFTALTEGVKGGIARGVRTNGDYIGIEWGFGPKKANGEVDVKASGSDVIFVERDGEVSGDEPRIKVLYVLIDGLADTRVKV